MPRFVPIEAYPSLVVAALRVALRACGHHWRHTGHHSAHRQHATHTAHLLQHSLIFPQDAAMSQVRSLELVLAVRKVASVAVRAAARHLELCAQTSFAIPWRP